MRPSIGASCQRYQLGFKDTRAELDAHLCQCVSNGLLLRAHVQSEHLPSVDHKGNDTRCDQNGDEQRRNWVEARPSIELDQERRDDYTNRAQGILSIAR